MVALVGNPLDEVVIIPLALSGRRSGISGKHGPDIFLLGQVRRVFKRNGSLRLHLENFEKQFAARGAIDKLWKVWA